MMASKKDKQQFFLQAIHAAIQKRKQAKAAKTTPSPDAVEPAPVKMAPKKPAKAKARFIARVGRGARGQRKQRRGGRGRRSLLG